MKVEYDYYSGSTSRVVVSSTKKEQRHFSFLKASLPNKKMAFPRLRFKECIPNLLRIHAKYCAQNLQDKTKHNKIHK
jgi:hypothetical protein